MTNAFGSDSVPTVPVSTVGLLDPPSEVAVAPEDVAASADGDAEDWAAAAEEVSAAAVSDVPAALSSGSSEPHPATRVSDARTHAAVSLLMSTSLIRGRSREG